MESSYNGCSLQIAERERERGLRSAKCIRIVLLLRFLPQLIMGKNCIYFLSSLAAQRILHNRHWNDNDNTDHTLYTLYTLCYFDFTCIALTYRRGAKL